MRMTTIILLLMVVVCTYARSFSAIDIPDPPSKETRNATVQPPTTQKPSTSPATTSSTLDPWDEFCKEACEEGLAGPECDCPDHPIGKRSVGNIRHRRSTDFDLSETDESYSLKHHYTSKAKPTVNLKVKRLLIQYCKIVCDYGIKDNICKCNGPPSKPGFVDKDPLYNINGSAIVQGNSTQVPSIEGTTKDPLEVFCETACSEGQGSLACNCHDHIVGRRRRSLRSSLTNPVNQHYRRNSTQVPSIERTTKDPLEVFCETACSEGQDTLACNCLHIVGRRRRSLRSSLTNPVNQHYRRSLVQNQDITQLENSLPRITLHRDSVQPKDLNVNFPFRTLPEIIKVHKEKFARVQLHKDSPHTQDLEVSFPYKKMTEDRQK